MSMPKDTKGTLEADFPKASWEQVGRGQFGTIFKATSADKSRTVALKFFEKGPFDILGINDSHGSFVSEYSALRKCRNHPSIPKLYGCYETEEGYYIAMEYFPETSLDKIFKEKPDYTELDVQIIVQQVSSALEHCHSKGVVHRDVKMSNILVRSWEPIQVALCDFNFARCLGDKVEESILGTDCGTPVYMAPEVYPAKKTKFLKALKNLVNPPAGRYNYKCDLWSLGVMSYLLLSGKNYPFGLQVVLDQAKIDGKKKKKSGTFSQKVQNKVLATELNFLPENKWSNVTAHAKDFVSNLLVKDPEMRMGFDQVQSHQWLELEFNVAAESEGSEPTIMPKLYTPVAESV